MKRLERMLTRCSFPEDLSAIRTNVPEVAELSDGIVDMLYREYSEDTMCAGWLMISDSESVNAEQMKYFQVWLNEEVPEYDKI